MLKHSCLLIIVNDMHLINLNHFTDGIKAFFIPEF